MNLTDVIKQPVVTEKAMKLTEKNRFSNVNKIFMRFVI